MSNNLNITIHDFDSICRTCLSSADLKPLYERNSQATCLADMLIACNFLKFAEDDGLPLKICTNCSHEINQAFSFAKRCEKTDIILRNCVKQFKTDLENGLSRSQTVLQIYKTEEEIEIKPEIILPAIQTVEEIPVNYEYVDAGSVKLEKDEDIEEVKQEELIIKNEYNETPYNPVDDCDDEDVDEDQNKPHSEKRSSTEEERPIPAKRRNQNCFEKLRDFEGLKNHTDGNKNLNTNFQCTECDRVLTTKKLLQRHILVHGERKFLCSVCGSGYFTKSVLETHLKVHTGVRPYVCPVCGKHFGSLTQWNVHKLIHTDIKPHVCSVCNKAFTQLANLKLHMRIHTGEKPYSCEVCNKSFTQSISLTYHMRIHTGEKPYSCEDCGSCFSRKRQLTYHKRIHTGEKPNVCFVCNKGFINYSSLKYHMSLHTGEKPHSCGICGKSFPLKQTLLIHERTHTGEKPNICSICNKAFTTRSNLNSHMRKHNVEKPYPCDICEKSFGRNQDLTLHKRKSHKETLQEQDEESSCQ